MSTRPSDDDTAQALYVRMRERGETLSQAAESLKVAATDLEKAQEQLDQLGLIDPRTATAADAPSVLARSLHETHRTLDALVEQHVRTATLAQRYLQPSWTPAGQAHVEFFPRAEGAGRLYQRMDELVDVTEHQIVGMHPTARWTRESLEGGLARTKAAIAKGIVVRGLYAQISVSDPLVREFMREWAEHGVEVRVAPVIPTRMLIYDRRTAIVQADPHDLEAGSVLVKSADLVRSLAALYDYCWMTASEPGDVPRSPDGAALTDQQRAVLHLLAAGAKDSAIARSMGVSTRTITRLVGEVTAMLGASSRFQAGVRAARLGWLD